MNEYFKQVIKRFLSLLDEELSVRDKIPIEEIKLLMLQSFLDVETEKEGK